MNIVASSICCGIMQLHSIGNNPSQEEYDTLIKGVNKDIMLIASVTKDQPKGAEFLLKNGFKMYESGWKPNPNTGHLVALFVRRRENKTLYGTPPFDKCTDCKSDEV